MKFLQNRFSANHSPKFNDQSQWVLRSFPKIKNGLVDTKPFLRKSRFKDPVKDKN